MKEVTRVVYEAFDGTPHDSKTKCLAHERENAHLRLVGLSEADINDALTGEGDIADAIMTVAYRIRPLRPKAVRKPDGEGEPELPAPVGRERVMTAEEALNHVRS